MKNPALISEKGQRHFVVTQANSLVEAEYSKDLTARAHKTARLILSLISPDDKNLKLYTIPIDTLKKYLGLSANTRWGAFYSELENIATRLREKSIKIQQPDGDRIDAVFLAAFQISPTKGTVTFEISELLKPHLLELKKNYTSYLLTHIPKLRSSYSIRLYELLHQYRRIGKRHFELSDLQKKVGSNYQNKYNNFKRKVILQAQKDLKKHTDLAFTFTETKTGRKVTGIDFIILANKPKQENPNQLSFLEDAIEAEGEKENPAFSEDILKTLNELGISEQNIAKYLALGFDIIEGDKKKKEAVIKRCETLGNYYLEKLELTKHSNTNGNAAGFFIKALKEDWVNNKTVAKMKAMETAKKRSAAKKELEKLTAHIDKLSTKREEIKQPIIAELIRDDSILEAAYHHVTKEMGSFMKTHLKDVLHLPVREQYEKAIFISSGVGVYLMQNYPEQFKEAAAIDEKRDRIVQRIEAIKKEYPAIGLQ